jgi:hypothetical protein
VHADLLGLRSPPDVGQFRRREPDIVNGVQRPRDGKFERGRRGESGTHDHVAADDQVGPDGLLDRLGQDGRGPHDVGRPPLQAVADGCLDELVQCQRIHSETAVVSGTGRREGSPVDRRRQDDTAVVIDVPPEQIHTSGGGGDGPRRGPEAVRERLADPLGGLLGTHQCVHSEPRPISTRLPGSRQDG